MEKLVGNKYGIHRVIEPQGVLTQAAQKIDNDMSKRYSNEIICDVISLNIDSASFTQIEEACGHDLDKIKQMILDIVNERGKMQNPVTGSGGMFIGKVAYIGEDLDIDIKVGDKIASLVSLSMTPLKIDEILEIHPEIDRVDIVGQAVLFESALYAKLPDDISEPLALAALDVAGAPAQTAKLVQSGQSVLILGGAGKSGILCCYEAMKRVGPTGRVVAMDYSQDGVDAVSYTHLSGQQVVTADAGNRPCQSQNDTGGNHCKNTLADASEKLFESKNASCQKVNKSKDQRAESSQRQCLCRIYISQCVRNGKPFSAEKTAQSQHNAHGKY